MATKIRRNVIERYALCCENGSWTLQDITDERVRRRVEKLLAERKRYKALEAKGLNVCRLTGFIRRETPKAVLFEQSPKADDSHYLPGQNWFPKSQVQIVERALGDLDFLLVPAWLLEAKQESRKS